MDQIKVKIVNKGPHGMPQYSTPLSAGMDLRAWLQQPLTLQPLQRALVHTGIYIALPEGCECQIRPRSGLALKRGLTVLIDLLIQRNTGNGNRFPNHILMFCFIF